MLTSHHNCLVFFDFQRLHNVLNLKLKCVQNNNVIEMQYPLSEIEHNVGNKFPFGNALFEN